MDVLVDKIFVFLCILMVKCKRRSKAIVGIIGCLFFLFSEISGQQVVVLDKVTKEPVSFANIKVGVLQFSADLYGVFFLDESGPGDTISISALGYEKLSLLFEEISTLNYEVFLKPSINLLESVIVSGSRWAEKEDKSVLKIERLNKRKIGLESPQTAADLLGRMNHVFVQKSQLGGGSPIIRGFATSRVLIAVDGVRMNNAIFRAGNVQNVLSLDPYTIEATEVSYGPGAVLYGSDAIGGVMNFYTTTPRFQFENKLSFDLNVSSRYSSANNEATGHLDFALKGRSWSWFSSLTYSDFDDLRMGSRGPSDYLDEFVLFRENDQDFFRLNPDPQLQSPTGYNQFSTLHKLATRPSDNCFLTYSFYYSQLSDVPRYDRLVLKRNNLPQYGKWNYGPQKWLFQNIKYEASSESKWYDKLSAVIGHQNFEESRITRDFNSDHEKNRTENLDVLSVNLDFRKKLRKGEIFYGLEGVYNGVESKGIEQNILNNEESIISSRYPNSTWSSIGGYVSRRYPFSEKWMMNSGFRLNTFSIRSDFNNSVISLPFEAIEIDFATISGNLGLTYMPHKHHRFNYILSSGMRAPNIDDIGKIFDSTPGNVVVPNPELKAENAYNAEVGYRYNPHPQWSFDINYYYTYLDNAMVRRDFTLMGKDSLLYDGENSRIQSIQNAANAYVTGVQFGLSWQMFDYFRMDVHYNWQRGEEETDDGSISNSRHVVPAFGKVHFNFKKNKLQLDSEVVFQAEMSFEDLPISELDKTPIYAEDENGNPFTPSWWIWNLKANYAIGTHCSASLGFENLFDKRYRPYSSGISAPGRNVFLALSFDM
jgi:hemoglobin/transferrin/lactoferrin receptor protein